MVIGGRGGSSANLLSSALILSPGAEAWVPLPALPQALYSAKASLVGSRLRLTGGRDRNGTFRNEVSDTTAVHNVLFVQFEFL